MVSPVRERVRGSVWLLVVCAGLLLAACAPGGGGDEENGESALVEAARERAGSLASVQFYVTNQLGNTVSVVDIEAWHEVAEIEAGNNPSDIAVSSDLRRVYVANQDDGTVSFIDTRELEVTATVEVGPRPHAMVLTPDNGLLFVPTLGDHEVVVVDTETAEVVARVELDEAARTTEAHRDPSGERVYVLSRGSDDLSIIDIETFEVLDSFSVGADSEPQRFRFSHDGSQIYVTQRANDQVVVFDAVSGEELGEPIAVGAGPTGLTLAPENGAAGDVLVVSNSGGHSVSVIDVASREVVATVEGVETPQQIAFNRMGTRFYVPSATANQLVVVETETFTIEDTIAVGAQPHDIELKAPATGGTCG